MKQTSCLITALCLPLAVFAQGPLAPPGAPAPLFKTLDQVEPRIPVNTLASNASAAHVISQRGSYYLTTNLLVTSARGGISIPTSDVSLDLNGFTILGVSNQTAIEINGPN